MPNWSALQVVDGFEDPAVSRIIAKLREIRSGKRLSPEELKAELEEAWAAKQAEDAKAFHGDLDAANKSLQRLRKEYESLGRLTKESSAKKRVQKPAVPQAGGGYNGDISGLDELIERLKKQDTSRRGFKKEAGPEKPPQRPSQPEGRGGYR
jgi:hypothetical protein